MPTVSRYMSFRSSKRFKVSSSYPVESSGGGLPAKLKKSKSSSSNGSIKKAESRKALSLEAAELEVQQQHKTLTRQEAIRSQTFDVDHRAFERTEGTGSPKCKHSNGEDLIHAYICALQKEVPYHVLLRDTKVVIPVSCGEKYLFVSLRNRESCYQLLRSVSPQIEDGSTNSSPSFPQRRTASIRANWVQNSSQSSLDDSLDRFDGSESRSLQEQILHRPRREAVPNGHVPPFRSLHMQQSDSSSSEELSVSGGSVVLLLLSSGYIGLRIVALEEQLTSLGALPEFTLQSGTKTHNPQ
ncbi:hypothetical protein KUCAC02_023267 [Chaenocephalus aceratus]|uniref:Uncharacterized protein n=1 Tax=Chaenocephalus aceratus TaxID=36190 RepID=A0ACB9XRQ8_CHAAC|nr:hypothetical protein KUCAC02_023267 [Chaenocephalus aceratus]